MEEKTEQVYLGDVISSDGKHSKNIQARKNKSLGVITQIMEILQKVFFGKYFFEVAIVLRTSLLLSSLLLNSEAWVNLSEKDVRSLEQTDEILLSKILGCEANTSNVFKYLELGIYPIRFEIMKRKIIFLQYILQQEKTSMMYRVFEVTCENPIKNDFVEMCKKYLGVLDINITFDQISTMSTWSFKKLVKQKTHEAAFKYLIEEKSKQSKILNVKYEELKIQEYLLEGNKNTEISRLIFKARGKCLDIKTQKSWKYKDILCVGCGINDETWDELISCRSYGEQKEEMGYDCFFSGSVSNMYEAAKVTRKRLKRREKILEEMGEESS